MSDLVPEITTNQVRRAMREAIPSLVTGLWGDERNVLLTLARMLRTAKIGEFVSQNTAANWAVPLVLLEIGHILRFAGEASGRLVNSHVGSAARIWLPAKRSCWTCYSPAGAFPRATRQKADSRAAKVPIDKFPAPFALKHGREVASANEMPLYVSTSDDHWDESWGTLPDSFVERD